MISCRAGFKTVFSYSSKSFSCDIGCCGVSFLLSASAIIASTLAAICKCRSTRLSALRFTTGVFTFYGFEKGRMLNFRLCSLKNSINPILNRLVLLSCCICIPSFYLFLCIYVFYADNYVYIASYKYAAILFYLIFIFSSVF